MHLASIFFLLLFISISKQCEWFGRPFATKNTGYQFMQLFRRKFLVISCETHPLKIIISPQLGKMLHHEIREKKYVWRTITHWPASSSGLPENFYKQPHLRDLSLFIICRWEGAGAGVKGFAGGGLCWSHDYLKPLRAVLYIFIIPTLPL